MLMRRKLAETVTISIYHWWERARVEPRLTIHLCSLDLLEQALEPSKRRSVTADPEEFDTSEGTKSTALLPVPDVLKDRGERGDTNTGTDEDGDFGFEDVFGGSTVGTINANDGERASVGVGVELNKVTTTFLYQVRLVILLKGLHGSRRKGLHDCRSGTDTLAKRLGEVTDLTDVNRHVGVFRGRSDRKLSNSISQIKGLVATDRNSQDATGSGRRRALEGTTIAQRCT
jgi:hypothetical protein